MVTVKFDTEKMDKGQFLVFPTILIDTTEKAEKARMAICFAWLRGLFEIGIEWAV